MKFLSRLWILSEVFAGGGGCLAILVAMRLLLCACVDLWICARCALPSFPLPRCAVGLGDWGMAIDHALADAYVAI